MKYISNGTWFKEGTEATLIDDCRPGVNIGLFSGFRVCTNEEAELHPVGEEYEDEEVCGFDEFTIIEE